MPPVIVAAASAAAFAGASALFAAWTSSVFLASLGASVVAMGVSYGGSRMLGIGPQAPAVEPLETPDLLLTNAPSNTAPIPVVYGQRRMGGTIVFAEVSGDENEHLDVVYAICEGEVEEIGPAYLDNVQVPELDTPEQSLLELEGPNGMWLEIAVKAAEVGDISGTYSGTWTGLQAWAASTYGGTVSFTRGGWEFQGGEDPPPEPESGYSVSLSPYNLNDWTGEGDPQVVVAGDGMPNSPFGQKTAVDIIEKPTVDNGHLLRMRIEARGGDNEDGAAAAATYEVYTQGDISYAEWIEIHRHTGADDQLADADLVSRSENWTASHRLQGVAYVYMRFRYNRNAFPRGVPTATWDIKGRKLYDPRDESTSWTDNPSLAILDYLTNSRYGRGVGIDQVDLASFQAAANYCDLEADAETGAKYWTCNGAILTNRTALVNMRHLLSSCRGWLTFSAGKYRLILDAPASATFTFDKGNITGAWQFHLGDKKTTANRVEAKFFDPDQDYRPDFAPADSEALRALDRGLMLKQELSLELTNSKQEAYRHAVQSLNQSRQGIVVQFAALPEAWNVVPGDVVYITHSRPGWTQKKFRVLSLVLRRAGDVEVTCLEYADSVYDWGAIPVFDTAPNTNLPSPLHVAAPGAPLVTESLYSTRGGAGVKAKAVVSWAPSPDAYVSDYILEARRPDDLDWRQAAWTKDTSVDVLDVEPGSWNFRVQAANALGVRSEYSEMTTYTVRGLLAPPATPTGLSVTAHSFLALLTWDPAADLDVRVGGSFRVRHAPAAVSSPTWDDGQDIGQAVAGSATQVVLPLLAGTYMVKAVDSSGIESNSPAVVVTDAPGLWGLSQVGTWTGETAWTGTHTDTEVDTGALQIVESGGKVTALEASWESGTTLDLGSVKRVQLLAELEATAFAVQDTVDARTDPIDLWDDFDGAVNGAARAEVWVSVYDGVSTWGPWTRLTAADFHAQTFKFKVVLKSTAVAFNCAVTGLTVDAKEVA